ncbi:MAG: hypothetical protein AB7P02_03070 [Alphaproteobacteria bacterium]
MSAIDLAPVASRPGANPGDLIDRARYPVDALDRPDTQALIARCHAELVATGACLLPGFLTAEALATMAAEARQVAPLAHNGGVGRGTAYLEAPDESLPEGHPRRRLQTSSVGAVAYDLIPPGHVLRRLYEWEPLLRFIEAVVGRGRIFRYADPMGALNIAVMAEGDHLFWHFDQTDFVTSILLQDCESGGAFEYVPLIRGPGDERYDRVRRLLDGDRSEVVTLAIEPGTFAFFEGRHSIHRVSPIAGRTDRLIALLGYDTKPDTVSSDRLKLRRYGRLA